MAWLTPQDKKALEGFEPSPRSTETSFSNPTADCYLL
jgi:hypothetical protein